MNATKLSAPRYLLGTRTNGSDFLFTGLPTFRSGLEAGDYYRAHNMNGVVYIYEERDVSRLGVTYGIKREIIATATKGER